MPLPTYAPTDIKDFDQDWPHQCEGGPAPPATLQVPGDGHQYCFPASALNWLTWIEQQGTGGGSTFGNADLDALAAAPVGGSFATLTDNIRAALIQLGDPANFNTDPNIGMLLHDAAGALYQWLSDKAPTLGYVVVAFAVLDYQAATQAVLQCWIRSGAMPILQVGWHTGNGKTAGTRYQHTGTDHFTALLKLRSKKTGNTKKWWATLANSSSIKTDSMCHMQTSFDRPEFPLVREKAYVSTSASKQYVLRVGGLTDAATSTATALVDGAVVIDATWFATSSGADIGVYWWTGSTTDGELSVKLKGERTVREVTLRPFDPSIAVYTREDSRRIWTLDLARGRSRVLAELDAVPDGIEFAGPRALLHVAAGDRLFVLDESGRQLGKAKRLPFAIGPLVADTLRQHLYAVSRDGGQVLRFDLSSQSQDARLTRPVVRELPVLDPGDERRYGGAPGPERKPGPQQRPEWGLGRLRAAVDPRSGDLLLHRDGAGSLRRLPGPWFEKEKPGSELPPPLELERAPDQQLRSLQIGLGGRLLFVAQGPKGNHLALRRAKDGRIEELPGLHIEVGHTLSVARPYNGAPRPTLKQRRRHQHVPPRQK